MTGQQEAGLEAYVPRTALNWITHNPGSRHLAVDGTLAFVDVSGFTALTERLATRGKVGAEEITGVIGEVFGRLLGVASSYGADLLKWGGDAVLLLFAGQASAATACRASMEMTESVAKARRFKTSAGRVSLGVSIGVHSGIIDLYLLGESHRELVVTGPYASETVNMESAAEAGEVVISSSTASQLDPSLVGSAKGAGFLLVGAPQAEHAVAPALTVTTRSVGASLMSDDTLVNVRGRQERAEHRQATVAFIEFSGVDLLLAEAGTQGVAEHLDSVIRRAQDAGRRYGINFQETDIGSDGGKIVMVGGIPRVRGDDAERVMRAVLEIVGSSPEDSPIKLRAALNSGRLFVFAHQFRAARRQVFATTGDTMNLAARVMGKAPVGQVWCTQATMSRLRNPFDSEELPPFAVKGLSAPVVAHEVRSPRAESEALQAHQANEELPFVGRDAEMDRIMGLAERAASGSGAAVDIVGPAGIGKSRLVSEAMAAWSLNTLRIPCDDYGGATPYLPFRKAFQILMGIAPGTPDTVAEIEVRRIVRALTPTLERFLPLVGDLLGIHVTPTPDVDALEGRFRRTSLERCVLELVKAYLSGPSALVFEDAQGMDEASASLLDKLALEVDALPLLIVLTRREGEGIAGLGEADFETLSLEPLGHQPAAALAGTSSRGLTRAQIEAVVDRAAGNPLFLRELLRSATESNGTEELPDSLEPLLVAAIDQVEAADRQVLLSASVLGTRFDLRVLVDVLGAEAQVDEGVLSRLGVFVVRTGMDCRFAHTLVREAAYEGLPYKRRREIHSRAATALERVPGEPPVELLSLHLLRAERYDAAWTYSKLAADRARSLWANGDAAMFYERALQAASHLRLTASDVLPVAEALGDTSEVSARYERSRSAYLRARRLSNQPIDRARLLRKLGVLHERQGRYRQALSCYSRGRRVLGEVGAGPSAERCELSLASAATCERQGRYDECLRFARQAETEAREAGHRTGLAHALFLQQVVAVYVGQPADSLAHRALAMYEELGDLVGQGSVLNNLGIAAYYAGRWEEALDYYKQSREVRLRCGDVVGEATAANNLAEILSDQGALQAAKPMLESARTTWSSVGYRIGVALATSNLGRLLARSGQPDEGRETLLAALEAFETLRSPGFESETRLRLLECDVLGGNFASAQQELRELLQNVTGRPGFEQIEIPALRLLGVATALSPDSPSSDGRTSEGRADEAADLLDLAAEKAEAFGNPFERALSLATYVALAELGLVGRREGKQELARRKRLAQEVFGALGVEEAVVTFASTGACLYAFKRGRRAS